jgi:UDP-glucose 4-epimerase
VVDVLARAAHERKASTSPVNLAFGSRRSLNQLLDKLAEATGLPVSANYLEPRVGDVRDSQASSTLLNELFNDPVITKFEDALQETAEWFMAL